MADPKGFAFRSSRYPALLTAGPEKTMSAIVAAMHASDSVNRPQQFFPFEPFPEPAISILINPLKIKTIYAFTSGMDAERM